MHVMILLSIALGLLWLVPAGGMAPPSSDPQDRAQELAARFNKSKHKVKDKRGVHIEIKIDITSVPAAKPAAEYVGGYNAWDTYSMQLSIRSDGQLSGDGTEPSPSGSRAFTLRETRLEGALLTGTKVYQDGATENFEGVFISRTIRSNMQDRDETVFGLGVVYDQPVMTGDHGFQTDKMFYEMRGK
jgi:hypothetical protein